MCNTKKIHNFFSPSKFKISMATMALNYDDSKKLFGHINSWMNDANISLMVLGQDNSTIGFKSKNHIPHKKLTTKYWVDPKMQSVSGSTDKQSKIVTRPHL